MHLALTASIVVSPGLVTWSAPNTGAASSITTATGYFDPYLVSTGTLVQAVDHNYVQGIVEDIAGQNPLGYGASDLNSNPVTTGTQITRAQWSAIVEDLNRISIHQSGGVVASSARIAVTPTSVNWAVDISNPNSSTIIGSGGTGLTSSIVVSPSYVAWTVNNTGGTSSITTATGYYTPAPATTSSDIVLDLTDIIRAGPHNDLKDLAEGLYDNRYTVADSQLAPKVTVNGESVRFTPWDGAISHVSLVSWPSEQLGNYFFNAGGYLEVTANQTGTPSGASDQAWSTLINSLTPVRFTRDHWLAGGLNTSTQLSSGGVQVTHQIIAVKNTASVQITSIFNNTTATFFVTPDSARWFTGASPVSGPSIFIDTASATWYTGNSIGVSPSAATWYIVTGGVGVGVGGVGVGVGVGVGGVGVGVGVGGG